MALPNLNTLTTKTRKMKYEFKGTRGEWSDLSGDNASIDIVLDNNTTITVSRYDRYGASELVGTREEMEANAHLIAASPRLLQALVAHTVINTDTAKWDVVGLNDECLFSHESIAQCNEYIHHLHGTAIHSALNIEK